MTEINALESFLHKAKERELSLKSKEFELLLKDKIDNCFIDCDSEKFLSLDVFDTVVLRPAISEIRHFFNISKKIEAFLKSKKIAIPAVEILVARYISTEINYKTSPKVKGCREGSIIEIYASIIHQLDIKTIDPDDLVQIELDHEKEILIPNHNLWTLIKKYQKQDCKVFLLSDMYFHSTHIKELVNHFYKDYDKIVSDTISSADQKISKASGLIFPYVIDKFQINNPKFCVHVGDSLKGDFQQPIRNGMNSIFLPKSRNHDQQVNADKQKFLSELFKKYKINFSQWVN